MLGAAARCCEADHSLTLLRLVIVTPSWFAGGKGRCRKISAHEVDSRNRSPVGDVAHDGQGRGQTKTPFSSMRVAEWKMEAVSGEEVVEPVVVSQRDLQLLLSIGENKTCTE